MNTKRWAVVVCALGLAGLVLSGVAWAGGGADGERSGPTAGCELPRYVALNPNACLASSGVRWKDPGLVRHYRDLTEISVQNTSSWRLGNIAGEVTWINGDGSAGPTVPFSTSGAVPVGAATTFTQAAGTLASSRAESNAPSYRVRFTRAEINQ